MQPEFNQQFYYLEQIRLQGIGDPDKKGGYLISNLESYLDDEEAHLDTLIKERKQHAKQVLRIALEIAKSVFDPTIKTNTIAKTDESVGYQEQDETTLGHSYRSARILIDELGIWDSLTIMTTTLHDMHSLLTNDQIYFFEHRVREVMNQNCNDDFGFSAEDIIGNLRVFRTLHDRLISTSESICGYVTHQQDIQWENQINDDQYRLLQQSIAQMLSGEYGTGINLQYYSITDLLQFAEQGAVIHTSMPEYMNPNTNLVGPRALLALSCATIDNHRNPVVNVDRKAEIVRGINIMTHLTPWARTVDYQPLIAELSFIEEEIFFPLQTTEMKRLVESISPQFTNIVSGQKVPSYFDTNLKFYRRYINQTINALMKKYKEQIPQGVAFVSRDELEMRKLRTILTGSNDKELLLPHEIGIIFDKKTLSSLIQKLRKNMLDGDLLSHLARDMNQQDTYQQALREYLEGAKDIFRFTVILGRDLLKIAHTIIEDLSHQTVYLDEVYFEDDKNPNYVHFSSPGQSTIRQEAEEWKRGQTKTDIDNALLEYHLIFNPGPFFRFVRKRHTVPRMQAELHILSAKVFFDNMLGDRAHFMYKLKSIFGKNTDKMSPDEIMAAVQLYHDNITAFSEILYGEVLNQVHDG